MLIEWTQPNLFTVWQPKKERPTLSLLPGINEIEESVWKEVSEHPLVKVHMDEDNLIVREKPSGDRKKSSKGLASYDLKEAKRIVKQTYDTTLLDKWKADESRKGIVTEIDKQIEKVNAMAKPKNDDDAAENE